MPVAKDTFVDPLLTDVSVKYTNQDDGTGQNTFIAEKVAPVVNVPKKTGYYFVYDKKNLKSASTKRTGVSRANRVDYALTKTSYGPLTERSLEAPIEYDVLNMYSSPLEPRTDATELVTEMLLIEKENDLATDLANTSIVTQNVTLSGTSQWSDYANSTPFSDVQTAISTVTKAGTFVPNTIWMGQQVWDQLVNHPDILERIKYTQRGVVTPEIVASVFGVQNAYVGSAVLNSAQDGQTDSLAYIWGKNFWVGYVTPNPGIRAISAMYHLTLQNGRYVDRWDEPQVKAEFVRANDYYDRKLIAVEALYLIKNAVA